jgi:hypothetical protein
VQVGPAMTCVRSTTFNPVSGPMVSPRDVFVFRTFGIFECKNGLVQQLFG